MPIEIGQVEAIFRYPVKSMAGERMEFAHLGWHGIDGDRRLALRRTHVQSGFPWLSATKLPDLLRFTPLPVENGADIPTHVRTPEGKGLAVFDPELAVEIERRLAVARCYRAYLVITGIQDDKGDALIVAI